MKSRNTFLSAAAAVTLCTAAPALAQVSGGVVKLGVLNDMSSVYADISGPAAVVAAKLAIEDFQKMSKAGLKVEVVSADHQNKPDIGSSIARKWYDTEGVDAIFDVPTSSVGLAVAEVSREKNKANINSGSATTELTGKACSPNTVHWVYDTWMLANGTGKAVVNTGGDTWFFLSADYAFGHALERDTEAVVVKSGGKVVGKVRHPLNNQDFSSFLLQAQASKAKIIGLANTGNDTVNAVSQAAEFGIAQGGQKLAGMLLFLPTVHGMGLEKAQGMLLTETFYWDQNEQTRAWTKRFVPLNGGKYPSMVTAGVYASVLHYLKAVEAGMTDDGAKVVAKMKELPTDDPLFGKGTIRADGRKLHPAYLFEVKKPSESKGPYDYYKLRATIPADQAFRPINQSDCPLVAKKG